MSKRKIKKSRNDKLNQSGDNPVSHSKNTAQSYPNHLSDNQKKTQLLYHTPQWSFENSTSTLQSAIVNEASGYMEKYFVNDYDSIDQIQYYNGLLRQFYVQDDELYEQYVPIQNAQIINKIKENRRKKANKNDGIDSTIPQTGSQSTKSSAPYYNRNKPNKDDMIEKYVNESKLPVKLESDVNISRETFTIENLDVHDYFQKINSLLKSSCESSVDPDYFKHASTQTDLVEPDTERQSRSTQTDTIRYQRKMLRSQFLQNQSAQCDHYDIIHSGLIKSMMKYGQYVLLGYVVCNMIKIGYTSKSFPFSMIRT